VRRRVSDDESVSRGREITRPVESGIVELTVSLTHPTAMARGLRAVSAGRHVAPAPPPVLRPIIEYARAAAIGASPNAGQLADYKRICCALDDRYHEPRERVADGNEASRKRPIALELETPRTGTSTENAIDLGKRVAPRLFGVMPTFSQCA